MSDHANNLRRTRADMLGTDDETHYWECHEAADALEAKDKRIAELEAALTEIDWLACEAEFIEIVRVVRAALKGDSV